MHFPEFVEVFEVGPRDGLQDEPVVVDTETKLSILTRLAEAGFKSVQATSFTHPKWIPALRDADELASRLRPVPGLAWNALVPNLRGFERAHAAGIKYIDLVASASESHNKNNLNRTTSETMQDCEMIVARAHEAGIRVRGGVATAFGCPFEKEVPVERVLWQADWYMRMGVDELALADTIGSAEPRQVYDLFHQIATAFPTLKVAAHFHDVRGFGLANVLAAMEAGVTIFDSSIGGLGGCPYAPGAPGNLSTRLLVEFLEEMGVRTGIDQQVLAEADRMILQAVNKG